MSTTSKMQSETRQLEKPGSQFAAALPRELATAANMLTQPAAGATALAALGFGVASQALGFWAGLFTGALKGSETVFDPFSTGASARALPSARPAGPSLRLVEPAGGPSSKDAETPAAALPPTLAAPQALAENSAPPQPPIDADSSPVAELAAAPEGERSEGEQATSDNSPGPVATAPAEAAAPDLMASASPAALMPGAFRQPTAGERPESPDDLRAISGIGPKLQKVLNDLGIWTYSQIAALQRDEVAWLDDHLGFKGRIGRDGWIDQAARLAEKGAQPEV